MAWINEFSDNQRVFAQLLVTNVTRGVTGNNLAYLTVSFQDKTGTIDGKKWDVQVEDNETYQPGHIVEVTGDVIMYRNSLQMKIISGRLLDSSSVDASRFTMSAPVERDILEKKLAKYLDSIADPDCSAIVKNLVAQYYDRFVVYPAAVRNHHEYTSGLLFHTLSMADLAEQIIVCYPQINRDLLISGILLHDIGKTVELSGPIIPKYTVEGKMLGHISIMDSEIRRVASELGITSEIPMLLEHMVLSHHGKQEFGSPVEPLTREALLLNIIDDLDAKMVILDKAYAATVEGEFTTKIFPLDERTFYKMKSK